MKKILVLCLLICSFSVFSQYYRRGIEYKYDLNKMMKDSTVTWFGFDYSHVIINDPNVNVKEIKPKLIPYWYMKLENEGCGKKIVKKCFKGKIIKEDYRTIQSLVAKVPEEKFIDIYRVPIEIDSIAPIVSNYKTSGSGIGVVAIASEFRKGDISVYAFVTVFDIQTKEVYYVIKVRGKAGDKGGFGRFYQKGIREAMSTFKSYAKGTFKRSVVK